MAGVQSRGRLKGLSPSACGVWAHAGWLVSELNWVGGQLVSGGRLGELAAGGRGDRSRNSQEGPYLKRQRAIWPWREAM